MTENPEKIGDWRLRGQEKFLKGLTFFWTRYVPYREGWDHDHCEFCTRKFMVHGGDFTEGYTTANHYRWICNDCFEDFKADFEWKVGIRNT
jgi:hypothetical protein